ncbi:hypothetical protein DL546_004117 [Coniochaeta pulveracea]|uniref:MICOS complex subunit mic19 n=1 Tax=Coniochaeta pulveracea TaxID=177199 RepID=A0A420YBU9_9PEZI|nr:hypothetical protein DL546_004117 [Coniochaeta pulveracea]
MGSSASKPSGSSTPHVWKGSSPTSVSQDLVDSLQSSNETDVSRNQTLELQVQARVAAELKRIQEAEAAALNEKLSLPPVDDASDTTLSRDFVNKEVDVLKKKLESRRKVREIPDSVESARSDVVRCLRDNDRRPLDCWKEVEAFKEEVRRLEKGWVDKVVS